MEKVPRRTGEIHPAASIFPLLEGKEFEAMVEDIRANGLREPPWIHPDGRLLDGRNRLRACEILGLTPPYRVWSGDGSPESFVISQNLHRRHLTKDQVAAIAAKYVLPREREEAAKREKSGKGEDGSGGRGRKKPSSETGGGFSDDHGEAVEVAARKAKVGKGKVLQAEQLLEADPEAFARVQAGEVKLQDAVRKVKIETIKERAAAEEPADPGVIRDLSTVPGLFRCVCADPPWRYDDDNCSGAAEWHYPTMSIKQLQDLGVGKLAHEDGCHLWLWTTWPMIRDCAPLPVLTAWGFRWVGEIVWLKPGMGVGRWLRPSTEILILAVKGNLPLLRADQRGHYEAPRGRHSEKPGAFYELIESLTPGPRIELFARKRREGWSRHGHEA